VELTQGRSRRGHARARRHGPTRTFPAAASVIPYAVLAVPVGYLGLLTVGAWQAIRAGRNRTRRPPTPRHRFMMLVPAHNEERLIGEALASLGAVDYPPELVAVHVVADNCTDATADIVRAHGMEVHERHAPDAGGKGPALQWLLQRLWARGEPHDAVVIIDADTTISPNFLRVMDAKLANGAEIVQAFYAVRDAEMSPATAFRSAALAARHYLRPLARDAAGASVGLYGNGMVFRGDLLRSRTWSNHLTEDIEFQLECLLDGILVRFAADAVVSAEMPTTIEASQTQHQRWERGRLDMLRRFAPALARRSFAGGGAGRVAYADALVDQVVPPFSLLVAGTAVLSALSAMRAVVRPGASSRHGLAASSGLLAVEAAYVLSALRMTDAPSAVYRSLLGAPRMVLWKVSLWSRVLVRPDDVAWIRTARNTKAHPDAGSAAAASA
jgi:hypothetical protein